ncbi:MAG: large repetitive protein [Acidobacteriaceae bacterium]|jgi:hypothetical protein|nr:large repetitive protein [Acidobacteriaceae bacterium]
MRYFARFSALALCVASAAVGQTLQNLPILCSGGMQPDGYIDWSAMPPAPMIQYGSGPSVPIVATLPVRGIPGLTVDVAIVSMTVQPDQGTAPMPAYTVTDDSIHLNALGPAGTSTINMMFNKSVRGVSAVASGFGVTQFEPFLYVGVDLYPLSQYQQTNAINRFSASPLAPEQGHGPVSVPLAVHASYISIDRTSLNLQVIANAEDGYEGVTWSNVRVESGSAPDPALTVPTSGMQMWLRGDKGNNSSTSWEDLSPKAENATAANPGTAPSLIIDGSNCTPVYAFQGNQFLNFNRPIAGLNQMTIVLVAKSDQRPPALYPSSNAAIFWQENARWGNTFLSPYAEYATYRFGTTQVNTDELYTRPMTIGGDYSITTSVHNGSTNRLYVNGKQVQQTHGLWALGGASGAAVLGEGLNGTPFNGKIGEVLVWNRVLSETEMEHLNDYLKAKYGIH